VPTSGGDSQSLTAFPAKSNNKLLLVVVGGIDEIIMSEYLLRRTRAESLTQSG